MINEEFWNRELTLFEIPKFQCPNCQKGLLLTEKENTIEKTTKQSKDYYDEVGQPDCLEGHFLAIANCNNPDCQEITTIVGITEIVQHGWDSGRDPDTDEYLYEPDLKYETIYKVKYTNPSIRLIRFPQNTPYELEKIINESFQLFWVDEASCGNKIRSGIEKLLDLQKVNKTTQNRAGKRQLLNLHDRILKFKMKEPEVANYLLALKWIGNQGSHSNTALSKKELVDAYKILEVSLIDLYDKTRLEVNRLTKKINKDKKHNIKTTTNKASTRRAMVF